MKIQAIKFTVPETAIDVDPGLAYQLTCKEFETPWFMYEEDFEVPVIDREYFAPSGINVRCENNQIVINCPNAGYLNTIIMYIDSSSFSGAVETIIVDLSQADNVTVVIQNGGAHYTVNGPFTANYQKVIGTDTAHTYEEAQNLNVVQAQFNGITYEVDGNGTQTGNTLDLYRYVNAYVDKG